MIATQGAMLYFLIAEPPWQHMLVVKKKYVYDVRVNVCPVFNYVV
jgi:hypothetical protein